MQSPSALTVSKSCGMLLMLAGVAIMSGWLLDVRWMVQFDPTTPPIQFNTALCLTLCGTALTFMSGRPQGRQVAVACAVAVLLIAGATALEYLLAVDCGIDQLFVDASFATPDTLATGRMSPQTVVATLTAAALLLMAISLPAREITTITSAGGLLLGALAVTALVGYFASLPAMTDWLGFIRMSPQTAGGVLILAAGIMAYGWSVAGQSPHWMPASLPVALTVSVWLAAGLLYLATVERERQIGIELARTNFATVRLPSESWLPMIVLMFLGAIGPILGVTAWQYRRAAIAERLSREGKSRVEALMRRLVDVELRSQLVLEMTEIGVWDLNLKTGAIEVDDTFKAILGRAPTVNPIDDASWAPSIHPDDEAVVRESLMAHIESKISGYYEAEYRSKNGTGEWIWVKSRGHVVERDAQHVPLRMVGTLQNVDVRKRAELSVKDMLRQKEVLLRELHHRVKNNLANVSSLLYLQAANASAESAQLLDISRQRVHAMAMVHELLYRADDLTAVGMRDYIGRLTAYLQESFEPSIAVVAIVDDVTLNIDQAVPCGLIVNELMTNAAKHAFAGVARPTIEVVCRATNGRCTLATSDNGTGGSASALDQGRGMGLDLVRAMAHQLAGECRFADAAPGLRVTVAFDIATAGTVP